MQAIYERLGGPSARQLRTAALREGLDVSVKQVADFVARQQDAQIFKKAPASDSTTATRGPDDTLQIDLIDLKQFSGVSKVILIACNPWNRKVYMEPLPNKTVAVVTRGFRSILNRTDKVQVVSSDLGTEFGGIFNEMLNSKNIVHRYKATGAGSRNNLAVLDRAIQTIKTQLFKRLTRKNTLKWDSMISDTEKGYNESLHGHLLGAPDDTENGSEAAKIEQFQLQKINADAFVSNNEKAAKKMDAVREAGAFREAKKPETCERSFKPKYGELRTIREVKAGQVVDTQGKRVAISNVKAVPADTVQAPVPDFRGRGLRDKTLQTNLRPFALELYEALGQEDIALTAASRLMGPEFQRAKPSTLLFGQWLALYPTIFKVTGVGTGKKVRRVRTRARGKQPDTR